MVDVKRMISDVTSSKEYIEYIKYHENNIFSITKVSRWELLHSNFIVWLFNPKGSHGLGLYPIDRFIQMIYAKDPALVPASHSTDIFLHNCSVENVEIFREYPVPVKAGGKSTIKKIDILIKVNFKDGVLPIVIENKVGSHENGDKGDQTEVYYNWARTFFKSKEYFPVVYLCLVPLFNVINPKCSAFRVINYQDLVSNVIEPCLWTTNNIWTHDILNTYLKSLSYQLDNEKGQNTMAISSEERKILKDFLDNNENFVNSLLDIWQEDASEEDKETIKKAREIAKDYSIYCFDGQEYPKKRLATAVVKKYIEDYAPKTYADVEKLFKKIGRKNNIVRKKADMPDVARYDFDKEFIRADGIEFGVSNQWSVGEMDPFIKYVTDTFDYEIVKK